MQDHVPKVALAKNHSEKIHKFHRKEPLMKSFLSQVVVCDFTEKELHHFVTALKPIQEGPSWGCSQMVGSKTVLPH